MTLNLNGTQTYQQADSGLPDGTTQFRWGGGREGAKRYSLGGRLTWDINPDHQLALDYLQSEWRTLNGPAPTTSNPGGTAASTRGPAKMERESLGLSYSGYHSFGSSRLAITQTEYTNDTTAPTIINGQKVQIGQNSRGPIYQTHDTQAVAEDLVVDGSLSIPFEFVVEQSLTLGGQWQKSELDNPNSVGSEPNANGVVGLSYNEAKSYALFAEDQLYLTDNLNLTLGLRMDDHDDFGTHVSPRAYVVYHPAPDWTIRGGYSEGFRAPSLRESNPNFVGQSAGAGCLISSATGCSTRGNADLKPETTQNWELGASWERGEWQASLTFFTTDFEDKIDERGLGYLNGPAGRYWQEKINIGEAVSRGLEASVVVPLFDTSMPVLWRTNVTHMLKAENEATGEPLSAVPEWAANSSLDWQITDALGATFQAEFIGKQVNLDWRIANQDAQSAAQRIEHSYVIYDLAMNYQINHYLHLNAGIKNLFDRDPTGENASGNNFYVQGRRYVATITASF